MKRTINIKVEYDIEKNERASSKEECSKIVEENIADCFYYFEGFKNLTVEVVDED